jgi:nitrogen fixation/metabolism regulation signal transduction histidine kinase
VGAAILGFIALGRWTLRIREESLLMTRRLGRLARAIQPLSAALEHDPSAVVPVDAEGSVVYANAASHRVLGVSAPLVGQDVDEVFDNLHVDLQAALISGRDSIVAQGAANDDETLLVSSRTLTIDGNPHFLYMLRPVTQQVRRQEVEHWKKLIRVLSHELNNALAPITSLLSSARKVNQMTHQDPRLGSIFESIAERTGHLVSFIEGYREVARLPHPAPREMEWEAFLNGLESQKNFRRVDPVPRRAGYFDPIQLERVLINVLNNAHEAGSPAEDVCVEVIEEAGGFRINVMDRGTGMPEPVLKQAMLPFFSTKRTGTGVGLALSREIIEAHGGRGESSLRTNAISPVGNKLEQRPVRIAEIDAGTGALRTEALDRTGVD